MPYKHPVVVCDKCGKPLVTSQVVKPDGENKDALQFIVLGARVVPDLASDFLICSKCDKSLKEFVFNKWAETVEEFFAKEADDGNHD